MKFTKTFLSILVVCTLFFVSCSERELTQEEIVKRNIEEKITPSLNDAKSYEFVNLTLIDSITYLNNINHRRELFEMRLTNDENNINYMIKSNEEFPDLFKSEEMEKLKVSIKKNKNILLKINEVQKIMGDEVYNIASFTYLFEMRGNNKFGAKVLNHYYVQTSAKPELEIINMTTDKDKIDLSPNNFPNYKTIVLDNQ